MFHKTHGKYKLPQAIQELLIYKAMRLLWKEIQNSAITLERKLQPEFWFEI